MVEGEDEPHPDPNEEDYSGMIYIGRFDDDGRRVGFDVDNGKEDRCFMPLKICVYYTCSLHFFLCRLSHLYHLTSGIKYIFGTGFDETHKDIEEADLHHEHYGPDSGHDVPDRAHGKTREQVLHEKRRGELDLSQGPKPFGWFGECTIIAF